jgi:hypothetical protein
MEQEAKISSIALTDDKGEQIRVMRLKWVNDLNKFQIGNNAHLFMLSSLINGMDVPVFVGVAKKMGAIHVC